MLVSPTFHDSPNKISTLSARLHFSLDKAVNEQEKLKLNKDKLQANTAIQKDRIDTTEEIAKRASDLGPEANLADAGGVNLKRELERAASTPGAAPEIAEKALVGRLARSGVRIQQVFDAAG